MNLNLSRDLSMTNHAFFRCIFVLLLGYALHSDSVAQRSLDSPTVQLETIRKLLQVPEKEIDLANVKIVVDKMIDPRIDGAATLKKVNEIVTHVKAMVPANATNRQKFEALRSYVYEPGDWNQNRIFRYDLENDPMGTAIPGKLLANYLATQRGNCVSMPILFVIVGQKIGLDVTLSTAPEHTFVKFRLDDGTYINAETTHDGGVKLDASYIRDYKITPLAMKNRLYLRPLSKRESAVQIVITLTEFLSAKQDYDRLHPILDLLMQYDQKEPALMTRKGYAFYLEIKKKFISPYSTPNDIPSNMIGEYEKLDQLNRKWYEKAEALGWIEPSKDLKKAQENFAKQAAQVLKTKVTK